MINPDLAPSYSLQEPLFALISRYQVVAAQESAGSGAVEAHLRDLKSSAAGFLGCVVTVETLDPDTSPITAMKQTLPHRTPDGYDPGGRWTPRNGMLLTEHPKKVAGIIDEVNLRDAQLMISPGVTRGIPRILSPYTWAHGAFFVRMLDAEGNRQVGLDIRERPATAKSVVYQGE